MQKALTPMNSLENNCFAGDAVEEPEETDITLSAALSNGGRPLCNLHFADDIDLPECSEEELQQLTERLEKTAAGYGMEISSEKTKILVDVIKHRIPTSR